MVTSTSGSLLSTMMGNPLDSLHPAVQEFLQGAPAMPQQNPGMPENPDAAKLASMQPGPANFNAPAATPPNPVMAAGQTAMAHLTGYISGAQPAPAGAPAAAGDSPGLNALHDLGQHVMANSNFTNAGLGMATPGSIAAPMGAPSQANAMALAHNKAPAPGAPTPAASVAPVAGAPSTPWDAFRKAAGMTA